MPGPDDDALRGFWIDEQTWGELCEKAGLRCPFCGDSPEVEDAEFFLEEGCCVHCAALFTRMMRE
jgi:hypothetical protein